MRCCLWQRCLLMHGWKEAWWWPGCRAPGHLAGAVVGKGAVVQMVYLDLAVYGVGLWYDGLQCVVLLVGCHLVLCAVVRVEPRAGQMSVGILVFGDKHDVAEV